MSHPSSTNVLNLLIIFQRWGYFVLKSGSYKVKKLFIYSLIIVGGVGRGGFGYALYHGLSGFRSGPVVL